MHNEFLLSLIVPVEIKDDVVDVLIEQDIISGFTLFEVSGFSKKHSQFNTKEQVEGYRRFYKFEIMHDESDQTTLLNSLQPLCEPSHVRYWIYNLKTANTF